MGRAASAVMVLVLDREGFANGVDPEAIVAEEIDSVVSIDQTFVVPPIKKGVSVGGNGKVACSVSAEEVPIIGVSPISEALVISDLVVASVSLVNSNPIPSLGNAVGHLDIDLGGSAPIVAGTGHFQIIRAVIPPGRFVDGVVRRHFGDNRCFGLRFNTDGMGC